MIIIPRLAIGASWNPDTFDKSGILSLCWGDPGVGPTPLGPLILVHFNDYVVPVFDMRETAAINAPRAAKRTGYGSRLKVDLSVAYETNTSNPALLYGQEGCDNSLLALAGLFGQSTGGGVLAPFSGFPPYLFLTTTYQMAEEQWIPIELDPADVTDPRQVLSPKTFLRTLDFTVVSRNTYRRISSYYIPTYHVEQPPDSVVTSLSAPSGGLPPFTGNVVVNGSGIHPKAVVGDAIMVWFPNQGGLPGGPYLWVRLVLSSIASNRLSATVSATHGWPSAVNYPTTNPAVYKIQLGQTEISRTPNYTLTPFAGSGPNVGFTANLAQTKLIGGGQI